MKMDKVMLVILMGVGLLGFSCISMAQGAPDTKSACNYLTPDEVNSVLGPTVSQDSKYSSNNSCFYLDSRLGSDPLKKYVADINLLGPRTNEEFNMEYEAALAKGAKSIEVEGGLSYEAEAPDGIPSVFSLRMEFTEK